MSRVLHRWGGFVATHAWRVVAVWLLVIVTVVGLLVTQRESLFTSLTLQNTPAQNVLTTISAELPQAAGTQGTVAITATDGGPVNTPQRAAAIGQAMAAAVTTGYVVDQRAESAGVASQQALAGLKLGTNPHGSPLRTPAGPLPSVTVSSDGTTAIATVLLTAQVSALPSGALDTIMAALSAPLATQRMTATASGSLQPLSPPLGIEEVVGLVVAMVVLSLVLGSLLVAGLPILSSLTAVFIGVGGAYSLSGHVEMTTATPALGLMLGLAVGIDYALFVVHKQRQIVRHGGAGGVEAIARAVATAGSAVLFAGTTVVVALLGLLTLRIGFVTTMAVTAAATVVLAVALALSLVPALLGLLAARGNAGSPASAAVPRGQRTRPDAEASSPQRSLFARVAHRWVVGVTARPVITILVVGLALAALAVPARSLSLGMPSGAVAAPGSASRITYDAVTRALGEGANAPLVVALTPTRGVTPDLTRLTQWQHALAAQPHVSTVQLAGVAPQGNLVIYTVIPDAGPTAVTTSGLVTALRAQHIDGAGPVGVTGATAMNIDLSTALAAAIPTYLAVVAGLSLLVLLLVFRSFLVPIVATLGFLLSIGAAMGLTVTAFSDSTFTWLVHVDRAGPILSFLPIMATGILYGLAMDYQVFLGTSIREEHMRGIGARESVIRGFGHASPVVVAAAVIMVSVFGGFVLSSDTTIRQFGFVLSVGILLDAFLVRMTLMPAVLTLAGESAWWLPSWLTRLLPRIEVEGTGPSSDGVEVAPPAGEPWQAEARA